MSSSSLSNIVQLPAGWLAGHCAPRIRNCIVGRSVSRSGGAGTRYSTGLAKTKCVLAQMFTTRSNYRHSETFGISCNYRLSSPYTNGNECLVKQNQAYFIRLSPNWQLALTKTPGNSINKNPTNLLASNPFNRNSIAFKTRSIN